MTSSTTYSSYDPRLVTQHLSLISFIHKMGVPDIPERATEQIKQACVLSTGTGSRKSSANAYHPHHHHHYRPLHPASLKVWFHPLNSKLLKVSQW